jgi:polyhydroxybutyrate depolymerase
MRRMIRALPALALVLALLAVACSSSEGDDAGSTTTADSTIAAPPTLSAADCTPARTHASGETSETIASGGIDRQYMLHVPDGYTGATATALVFVFHPSGGTAQGIADLTGFGPAAEQRGDWIAVFPEATGTPQGWNAEAFSAGEDDIAFVRELLASLEASLCIDPQRVYATGYSNGGAMAMRAACDIPDVFAAVAPVASTYPSCRAAVPIIAFHGSQDPAVPYDGGVTPDDGVNHSPVHRAVSEWARAIGCDALPVISRAAMDVELATYGRCPFGDGDALLYTVLNGGHTWPGAAIDAPVETAGATTHAISATDLILEFFEAHQRP